MPPLDRQHGACAYISVGAPYTAVVEHPAGSTQFTYEGGRRDPPPYIYPIYIPYIYIPYIYTLYIYP
jgi:hypothetical protein